MADRHNIARFNQMARLQRFDAIDTHLSTGGEFDRKAAVLDDACVPEPAVDPERIFSFRNGLRDRTLPSFDLAPPECLALKSSFVK